MALSQWSSSASAHSSALLQLRTRSHAEASCSMVAATRSCSCPVLSSRLSGTTVPSRQEGVFQKLPCRSSNSNTLLHTSFLGEKIISTRQNACSSIDTNQPLRRNHSPSRGYSHHSKISASASTTLPTISLRNYSPEPFVRISECLVLSPTAANPRTQNPKPRGIIAFFGGAFVGAVPDFTYRFLLTQLAAAGYLVVAVPYQLTFDHKQAAEIVERKFQNCLETLYVQGGLGLAGVPGSTGSELKELPLFGMGHSNGALLHMLTNSLYAEGVRPKANVIMSFNNKPASEAVPYFDQVGPAVAQLAPVLRGSPFQGLAEAFASEATRFAASTDLPIPGLPRENLGPLLEIAQQIAPVIGQITDGVSEFRPTPNETRAIAAGGYYVPSTLLIKFTDDGIDETETLAAAIRTGVQSRGGALRIQDLTGNHVTPLIQEVKWEIGNVYTPLDAVRQTVQTAALADTRRLVSAIVSFLDSNI